MHAPNAPALLAVLAVVVSTAGCSSARLIGAQPEGVLATEIVGRSADLREEPADSLRLPRYPFRVPLELDLVHPPWPFDSRARGPHRNFASADPAFVIMPDTSIDYKLHVLDPGVDVDPKMVIPPLRPDSGRRFVGGAESRVKRLDPGFGIPIQPR